MMIITKAIARMILVRFNMLLFPPLILKLTLWNKIYQRDGEKVKRHTHLEESG
jgi:ferric iron reductase protein FhuF